MKKVLALFLLAIMLLSLFSCEKKRDDKINVVVTVYPEYDWVREITKGLEDNFNLTLLLDSGTDLHSYQPSAKDVMSIVSSDLFIYVGGESDKWVADALKEAPDTLTSINLMEVLGDKAKEEETVEGMQKEHDQGEAEEEEEYDEHVWLSLNNAALFVDKICDAIGALDGENKDTYRKNADAYKEKLGALDEKYKAAAEGAKTKTLLFCDRFPFRYLLDDYGLTYYAAFSGCSAESEASFETVAFLSNKIDELNLTSVIVIEGSNNQIANTVISNSKSKNVSIITLDSIQSVVAKNSPKSYLEIMENNLTKLKVALNSEE